MPLLLSRPHEHLLTMCNCPAPERIPRYRNVVPLRISFLAASSGTEVAGGCTELSVTNRAMSASASSPNVTPLAKRSSTCAMSALGR
jgi:hypothetical protein